MSVRMTPYVQAMPPTAETSFDGGFELELKYTTKVMARARAAYPRLVRPVETVEIPRPGFV